MKYFLWSLLALTLLSSRWSEAQQGGQYVNTVYGSTNTIVQTVLVSSLTTTNMTTATSTGTISGGYIAIEVFPITGAAKINCGFDPSLSTMTYSVWYGREVAAATGVTFNVPSYRNLYCQSQGITFSSVTVTQYR